MKISIIIPAYNAEQTLAQTLNSVQSQTLNSWEVIIIDDGSKDQTAAIANQFAIQDSRIRVISQLNQGVSKTRNIGINQAKNEWLLFLDADDWISSNYLQNMSQVIAADPTLDAIHCGGRYVYPDGSTFFDLFAQPQTDLFPILASGYPLLIHTCIVRKACVEAIGGFDTNLSTSEDWDFWQRISRCKVRFGAIKEVMAFYRMRANSLSRNKNHIFLGALRTLIQGHSADPRVSNPNPKHLHGQPSNELPSLKLKLSAYFAGFWLACGEDARHLLKLVENERDTDLEPSEIAYRLFNSVLLPGCHKASEWVQLWNVNKKYIQEFLVALELQSQAIGLADQTQLILEKLMLEKSAIVD